MKLSVVIPSYNGWDRLGELCLKIKKSLFNNSRLEDFEIIIVDDGSKNRSDKQIIELRNMGIDVKGVFLNKNYGQQLATLAGLRNVRGDYIITLDDDLSHNPENFAELLLEIENKNFDAVFGIPQKSRTGLIRKSGSGIRDIIFNVFFNKPKKVYVSSFRILNRSLVDKIVNDISEYRYLSVEILKHTQAIGNIQVVYNRESGKNSRYGFIQLSLLAFSLISCSLIFPKIIRKSKIASEMKWELI